MNIREIHKDLNLSIQEKKDEDGFIGTLKFEWIKTDGKKNKNGRIYPEFIIKREIKKWNDKTKGMLGQLEHPLSGKTELQKASHIIQKLEYDSENKVGLGIAKILDTSQGRNVLELSRKSDSFEGLGVSLRGFATGVDKKTGIVSNDFSLESLDIVSYPSFKNAALGTQNLFESVNQLIEKKFFSLRQSLEAAIKIKAGKKAWIQDFSNDEVIYRVYSNNAEIDAESEDIYYKISYKISGENIELVGDAKKVERTVQYEMNDEKLYQQYLNEVVASGSTITFKKYKELLNKGK